MKRLLFIVMTAVFSVCAAAEEQQTAPSGQADELNPWVGKYCISFLRKARSTNVVPEGKLQLSLKYELFEADRKETSQGHYGHLPANDWKDYQSTVFCAKYGWFKDHQIAVGVPFYCNDFNLNGSTRVTDSAFSNIFVFEKWHFLKETNTTPAMSADFWVYFPTGDIDKKVGTEDFAYKAMTSISKAWKDFSLHLNPGYTWNQQDGDNNSYEVNAALLLTPDPKLWPTLEYNYFYKEGTGYSHDLVPGLIWKFHKGSSFKIGIPITLDSTITYKDRIGLVLTLSQLF